MTTNETTPGPQRGPASVPQIEAQAKQANRELVSAGTPNEQFKEWLRETYDNDPSIDEVADTAEKLYRGEPQHEQYLDALSEIVRLAKDAAGLRQAAKSAGFEFIPVPGGYTCIPQSPQVLVKSLEAAQAELATLRQQLDTEQEIRIAAEKYNSLVPNMCAGDFSAPCALHVRQPIEELWNSFKAIGAEADRLRQQLDTYEKALINGGLLIKVRSDTASGPQAMYAIAVSADEFNRPQQKGGE
jgi:hypothetical protein